MQSQVRGWAALAVLTAGLSMPARPLRAQAVPRAAQAAPRISRAWRVGIDAEAGYESNVRLQPGAGSDQVGRLNGLALRTWTRPRGHLTLRGIGSLIRYRESDDLDQFTFGVAGDAARRLTARLGVTGSAGYQTRLSSEISATRGPGVTVLPLSLSRTASASAGLAYLLSPDVTSTLGASYSRVTFDSPSLLPGTTLNFAGSLGRRLSPRSTVSLRGAVEQGETQNVSLATQSLSGEWATTSASERFGASAEAGVTRSLERELITYRPSGAATVRARIRGGLGSLRYAQSVTQAFGLGRLLATRAVNLNYTRVAFYGVAANAALGRSWNSNPDPVSGGTNFQTTEGDLDLRRVLSSGLTLGGGVLYRSVQQGSGVTNGAGPVSGTSAHLSIGYTLGGN